MAETPNDRSEPTGNEVYPTETGNKISRTTLIGAGIALLIIIFGAVMIGSFLFSNQGGANSNAPTSESRAKP